MLTKSEVLTIETLSTEAAKAGDLEMVALCARALLVDSHWNVYCETARTARDNYMQEATVAIADMTQDEALELVSHCLDGKWK